MANNKQEIIARISSHSRKFDPLNDGFFVCPVCLKKTPVGMLHEISEAHILPKSAGGSLKTYLCKACNSYFGSNQDAWFGEYLYLLGSGKGFFATRRKARSFTINGIKVSGEIRESDNGSLEVFTYKNLMPPKDVEALDAAHASGQIEVKTNIPIIGKELQIRVGFLTAAYLLWFKELGYSWVFQGHLAKVREQILNPNRKLVPGTFLFETNAEEFKSPWVGFVELGKNSYPCAGIADRIVLFPSFCGQEIYKKLAEGSEREMHVQYEAVRISNYHQFPEPAAVSYRDQLMILPDHIFAGRMPMQLRHYAGDGNPPQVMYQMNEPVNDPSVEVHVTNLRSTDA